MNIYYLRRESSSPEDEGNERKEEENAAALTHILVGNHAIASLPPSSILCMIPKHQYSGEWVADAISPGMLVLDIIPTHLIFGVVAGNSCTLLLHAKNCDIF